MNKIFTWTVLLTCSYSLLKADTSIKLDEESVVELALQKKQKIQIPEVKPLSLNSSIVFSSCEKEKLELTLIQLENKISEEKTVEVIVISIPEESKTENTENFPPQLNETALVIEKPNEQAIPELDTDIACFSLEQSPPAEVEITSFEEIEQPSQEIAIIEIETTPPTILVEIVSSEMTTSPLQETSQVLIYSEENISTSDSQEEIDIMLCNNSVNNKENTHSQRNLFANIAIGVASAVVVIVSAILGTN